MRSFSQADLKRKLLAAGFSEVTSMEEPVDRFGIAFEGPWSRPLVARKQPFSKLSLSPSPMSAIGPRPHSMNNESERRIAGLPPDHSPNHQVSKAQLELRLQT